MQEGQHSPIFSQYTQENIDVVWDWNSPQSKPRPHNKKRRETQNSPKLPVRRHPSNNQINVFDKLKEELETFKNHIDEQSDSNSNKQSNKSKQSVTNASITKDLDAIFDDSMEEQLLICSQNIEHELQTNKNTETAKSHNKALNIGKALFKTDYNENNTPKLLNANLGNSKNITKIDGTSSTKVNNMADDSLDYLLGTIDEEDLTTNCQTALCDENNFEINANHQQLNMKQVKDSPEKSNHSYRADEIERKRKEAFTKLEIKKKQTSPIKNESPIKCSPDEIEQKRLQALAKLQAKNKLDVVEKSHQEQTLVTKAESPIKCFPDEIEQKRLQALAKLKAKEELDIVEKNRQEALKRLLLNKRKRALQGNWLPNK